MRCSPISVQNKTKGARRQEISCRRARMRLNEICHSTVTDFARFRGLSTSQPLPTAT